MKNIGRIVNMVKELMGDKYEVCFKEIGKNNGLVCKSITILERGMKVGPSIHIDSLLEKIESGEISVLEAAVEITNVYREQCNKEEFKDITNRFNKEYALERVVYQIVSKEKNADLLKEKPHKDFLDLVVIYRVIVKEENASVSSMVVTNGFCDIYSISKDELDTAAKRNTEKRGFNVCSILSLLMGISDIPENTPEILMWVITNPAEFCGAAVMLYNDYFDSLAKKLESDLYILPSSIHEVIVVPTNNSELDFIRSTVCEINASKIAAEQVLSDNVYRYNRDNGMLLIA